MVRTASPSVVVLCYHAVSAGWPSELAVTPGRLRRQLALLLRRGYRGATFAQALGAPASGPTLVVTFDDAYRSTLTAAHPILAELGLPGTVFVPTDHAGSAAPMSWDGIEDWADSSHADELRCLDWDELRWLAAAGWEVGSHTRSHPRLPVLDPSRAAAELEGSRAAIEEQLHAPCHSLAYPYGAADEHVIARAGAAGYRNGALLGAWPGEERRLAWPRVGVYRADARWRFRLKLSPRVRRLRAAAREGRA
jgi:peptidoglycan/xylan/chitin deacetylase (PgdA/CDA1 family)